MATKSKKNEKPKSEKPKPKVEPIKYPPLQDMRDLLVANGQGQDFVNKKTEKQIQASYNSILGQPELYKQLVEVIKQRELTEAQREKLRAQQIEMIRQAQQQKQAEKEDFERRNAIEIARQKQINEAREMELEAGAENRDLIAKINLKRDQEEKQKKTNYSLKPLSDLDELEGKALKYLASRGTKSQQLEFLNRMRIDKAREKSGKEPTAEQKKALNKYRKDIEQFAILSDLDELVEKQKIRAQNEKKLAVKKQILESQLVEKS